MKPTLKIGAIILAFSSLTSFVKAQTTEKKSLTIDGAKKVIAAAVAYAQFGRGAGDFSTSGADAQRSSWIRSDAKISPTNLQKPGFSLLWKVKLKNNGTQGWTAVRVRLDG